MIRKHAFSKALRESAVGIAPVRGSVEEVTIGRVIEPAYTRIAVMGSRGAGAVSRRLVCCFDRYRGCVVRRKPFGAGVNRLLRLLDVCQTRRRDPKHSSFHQRDEVLQRETLRQRTNVSYGEAGTTAPTGEGVQPPVALELSRIHDIEEGFATTR